MIKTETKADYHILGRSFWETLISGAVFFILFYLYLWLVIEPNLIYHCAGEISNFPVFYKGWHFFNELVRQPGELVGYQSAFFSQLFYISWAGALVLTLHALAIYLCTLCILKSVKAVQLYAVGFLGPILLIVTYNKYIYYFDTAMAFLAALFFCCIYIKAAFKNKLSAVSLFLVLSVFLYIVAAGAFLLFAFVCGVYEIFFRRYWLAGILCFVSAAVIPYCLGVFVYGTSLIDAYCELLPISWKIISFPDRKIAIEAVYALYLFLPLFLIILGVWNLVFCRRNLDLCGRGNNYLEQSGTDKKDRKQKLKRKPQSKDENYFRRFRLGYIVEFLLILIIAVVVVFYSYDYKRKALFEVDYYASRGKWRKVLEAAQRYPNSVYVNHYNYRALYHLGRLPYEMFRYPQNVRSLFLSSQEDVFEHWKRFGTYFDLGFVNHCECALVESLEIYGEHPEILKRLAMIRMAKGDIGTARVYLGALSKMLFYSDWAENYLKLLDSEPNLSSDKEIQRLRTLMPERDKGAIHFPVEEILTELLEKDRKNRMAFEYLMALYMLTNNLEKFVDNIGRLNDFNHPEIPRYYEEALLTYMYTHKKRVKGLGYEISSQSQNRFNRFLLTADKYGTNEKAAFAELAQKFGDTYFFYYVYAFSGVKR